MLTLHGFFFNINRKTRKEKLTSFNLILFIYLFIFIIQVAEALE